MIISYLSLGSNMNDRLNNINTALDMLSKEKSNELLSVSSFYESKPMYNQSLNRFYNAVAKIKTSLSADMLLSFVKNILANKNLKKFSDFSASNIKFFIFLNIVINVIFEFNEKYLNITI